jgi:hypothetical protein
MKWLRFDGMTFPFDDEDESDESVEWRLRYSTPSKKDLMAAASIMSAYNALIFKTQKERNHACEQIKKQLGVKK